MAFIKYFTVLGISGKWLAANAQPHPGATQKTKWGHRHKAEAAGTWVPATRCYLLLMTPSVLSQLFAGRSHH